MTDETASLVLEHLRHLRARFDVFADDLALVKTRLTSLEGQVAGLHIDMATVHQRMDKIDQRLDRIERRLDLVDAR